MKKILFIVAILISVTTVSFCALSIKNGKHLIAVGEEVVLNGGFKPVDHYAFATLYNRDNENGYDSSSGDAHVRLIDKQNHVYCTSSWQDLKPGEHIVCQKYDLDNSTYYFTEGGWTKVRHGDKYFYTELG